MLKTTLAALAALFVATGAQAQSWTGKASWYRLGGHTASGGRVGGMTAAHRTLAFGTKLRVTNLSNRRSCVVTVNDRGPFTGGRVIDVSAGAADMLGFRSRGVAKVKVETVSN